MIIVGVMALFAVIVQSCQGPADPMDRFSIASLKGLTQLEEPPQRPNLSFDTLDGQSVGLAKFKGQVLLVNAWATWCPPCIIYDRNGREVARLSGEADWDSKEALALIDYWIAQ